MTRTKQFLTALLFVSLLGLLEGCGPDCVAGYDEAGNYSSCLPNTIYLDATAPNFSRTMGGKITISFFEFDGERVLLSAEDMQRAIVTVAQFIMAPQWSPRYDVGPGPHLSSTQHPLIQATSDATITIQLTPNQMKLFSGDPIFHDVLWVEVRLPGNNLGWTKIPFVL